MTERTEFVLNQLDSTLRSSRSYIVSLEEDNNRLREKWAKAEAVADQLRAELEESQRQVEAFQQKLKTLQMSKTPNR